MIRAGTFLVFPTVMADSQAPVRVLIVDDEEQTLQALGVVLSMTDRYAFAMAHSGAEALRIIDEGGLQGNAVEMVVTDLSMPGMNGMSLLRQINRRKLDIPVLAISGFGTKQTLGELMREGVCAYLDKPFRGQEFLECVDGLARTVESRRKGKSCREVYGNRLIHDMKNWLCAIQSYIEFMSSESGGDGEHGEMAMAVKNVVNKTIETAQQLRAVCSGDRLPLFRIDLHDALRRTMSSAIPVLPSSLQLTAALKAERRHILANPTLLDNAILNLILNARDAMPPAGGEITLQTTNAMGREIPVIDLAVIDTGMGIAPEHLPRIFDIGFTTKKSGNGLGLAGVKDSIEYFGGTVSVQSCLGKGTTFCLRFPAES